MAEGMLINMESKKERRRHYETIFIVSPTLSDAAAKELAEKNAKLVESKAGTLLRQDDWGKKKMAYEIEKHATGRYFYFRYISKSEALNAFERSLKLDANVIRYKTVGLSDILSADEEKKLVEAAPQELTAAPSPRKFDDDYESRDDRYGGRDDRYSRDDRYAS